MNIREFLNAMELWRSSLKEVEGMMCILYYEVKFAFVAQTKEIPNPRQALFRESRFFFSSA